MERNGWLKNNIGKKSEKVVKNIFLYKHAQKNSIKVLFFFKIDSKNIFLVMYGEK